VPGDTHVDNLHAGLSGAAHGFLLRVVPIGCKQVELLQIATRIQTKQDEFRHGARRSVETNLLENTMTSVADLSRG